MKGGPVPWNAPAERTAQWGRVRRPDMSRDERMFATVFLMPGWAPCITDVFQLEPLFSLMFLSVTALGSTTVQAQRARALENACTLKNTER